MMKKKIFYFLLVSGCFAVSSALFVNMSPRELKQTKQSHVGYISAKTKSAFHAKIITKSLDKNTASLHSLVYRRVGVNQLNYRWKLPDGVKVLKGALSGAISERNEMRHSQILEIEWDTWPQQKSLVYEVYSNDQNIKIGATAIWKPDLAPKQKSGNKLSKQQNSKPDLPPWVKVMQ